ncbi:MAG: TetR/AcrR family transcriptional regulator, partial [Clostridia bacterium]
MIKKNLYNEKYKKKGEIEMPTKIRISKDMILDAAFEIVRKEGIEKLSNRELANKLKCSIRPIYYQFENVEEMQK